tara:strand:+ start:453 stop:791 length:339 start_codon:yes stop_codon:yes gene_type:complete
MNYFTDLYFKTIDPSFTYIELLNIAVFYSIILHALVYSIIMIVIKRIFKFKINTNLLVFSLLAIMTFGYVGRLMRSKSIYNNLIKKGYNDKDATQETVNTMHHGYFRFYFIG